MGVLYTRGIMSIESLKPEQMDRSVVVYGTRLCGFCTLAKSLLEKRGIAYAWVDVSGQAPLRTWLQETSGQRTVPQVFIHGRSIGGYQELRGLDSSGELAGLVEAP